MQLILRLFYALATLLQLSHTHTHTSRALDKLQLPSTSTTGEQSQAKPGKLSRVEQCKRLACHSGLGRGEGVWHRVTGNNRQYILQTLRHFQQFVVFYYLILNCLGCHTNTQRGLPPLVQPELSRCRPAACHAATCHKPSTVCFKSDDEDAMTMTMTLCGTWCAQLPSPFPLTHCRDTLALCSKHQPRPCQPCPACQPCLACLPTYCSQSQNLNLTIFLSLSLSLSPHMCVCECVCA